MWDLDHDDPLALLGSSAAPVPKRPDVIARAVAGRGSSVAPWQADKDGEPPHLAETPVPGVSKQFGAAYRLLRTTVARFLTRFK